MSEVPDTPTVTSEPKTSVDVQLAEIQKQIETMKESYETVIMDLQAANRSLYARATGGETVDVTPEEPAGFSVDSAADSCRRALGLEVD